MTDHDKLTDLKAYFEKLGTIAVAFSGGVDSTFVACLAERVLGDKAIAITVDSPYIPRWEIDEAKELAASIGIRHELVTVEIPEEIASNPFNRCYLCKTALFTLIQEKARDLGFTNVADGSNFDDTKDYRPGLKALSELRVKSPLMENQWTKDEIRAASKELGLATHDKPAYACLLTRIPYDTRISLSDLVKIERSETYLMSLGFRAVRVRCHGDLARIEVNRNDRSKLFNEELLDSISERLKSYGFKYVAIEAAGYSMGSLNKAIPAP
ncbi:MULTISPECIES: ATP-dependent sacrificial sulfur transferase LarE [Desulfosediminicola]|uniref:ATP-dependent sacrificial sulfur transferase LarE n=1 Tax=Desulfosediminicola TaxID=2886823 RepID=UPI0010AC4EEB|nr:ATP-dependent sacrificial sulfur transferase LarE [Desulfosediminicola ganghwensis]